MTVTMKPTCMHVQQQGPQQEQHHISPSQQAKRPFENSITIDNNSADEGFTDMKTNGSSPQLSTYVDSETDGDDGNDDFALLEDMRPEDAPFLNGSWQDRFEQVRIFAAEHSIGLCQESTDLCRELLESLLSPPDKSVFDDKSFVETWEKVRHRDAGIMLRDLTPQIVPPPKTASSDPDVRSLMFESINERWSHSQPLILVQPQPTYAAGFTFRALKGAV
ncbi:hypothetical protein ACHAQJ_004308 [Trichoderma viride]